MAKPSLYRKRTSLYLAQLAQACPYRLLSKCSQDMKSLLAYEHSTIKCVPLCHYIRDIRSNKVPLGVAPHGHMYLYNMKVPEKQDIITIQLRLQASHSSSPNHHFPFRFTCATTFPVATPSCTSACGLIYLPLRHSHQQYAKIVKRPVIKHE